MEATIKRQFNLSKWILLSVAGWLIGVVIIIGLGIVTDSTGINLGGNSIVGVGMGAGVGWMQWIALKKYSNVSKNWIWFSVAGFTISYVAADIFSSIVELKSEDILPFATAIGAIITATLQYQYILNKVSAKAVHWIIANVVAWSLAHFFTMGMYQLKLDFLPHMVQIILAFSFLLIAAPVLGYITGKSINLVINNSNLTSNQ